VYGTSSVPFYKTFERLNLIAKMFTYCMFVQFSLKVQFFQFNENRKHDAFFL
jgi:hypothetical protein